MTIDFKLVKCDDRIITIYWEGQVLTIDNEFDNQIQTPFNSQYSGGYNKSLYNLVKERFLDKTSEDLTEDDKYLLYIITNKEGWLALNSHGVITIDNLGRVLIDNSLMSIPRIFKLLLTSYKTLNIFQALDELGEAYPKGLTLLYRRGS